MQITSVSQCLHGNYTHSNQIIIHTRISLTHCTLVAVQARNMFVRLIHTASMEAYSCQLLSLAKLEVGVKIKVSMHI